MKFLCEILLLYVSRSNFNVRISKFLILLKQKSFFCFDLIKFITQNKL